MFLQWAPARRVSFSVEVQFYHDNWESVGYTHLLLATTNRSLNRKRCRSCLCRPRLSSTRPSISRVLLEHRDDDRNAPVSMLAEGLSLQQRTPQALVQQSHTGLSVYQIVAYSWSGNTNSINVSMRRHSFPTGLPVYLHTVVSNISLCNVSNIKQSWSFIINTGTPQPAFYTFFNILIQLPVLLSTH